MLTFISALFVVGSAAYAIYGYRRGLMPVAAVMMFWCGFNLSTLLHRVAA